MRGIATCSVGMVCRASDEPGFSTGTERVIDGGYLAR